MMVITNIHSAAYSHRSPRSKRRKPPSKEAKQGARFKTAQEKQTTKRKSQAQATQENAKISYLTDSNLQAWVQAKEITGTPKPSSGT